MVKTTVYLDPQTAMTLRQLAGAQGRSQAELIREALAIYTRQIERTLPKGMGQHRSGRSDVSERAEELFHKAAKGEAAKEGVAKERAVHEKR